MAVSTSRSGSGGRLDSCPHRIGAAAAQEQLAGHLSRRIISSAMIDEDLAHIERTSISDEDIAPETRGQLLEIAIRVDLRMNCCARPMKASSCAWDSGGDHWPSERRQVQLAQSAPGPGRAIVSHLPGTTRDTIEETANVRGIPIVFIDTAGLRDATDDIEAEGVRRSRKTLAAAELILHVLDASEPLGEIDKQLLTEHRTKRLLVGNKADLPRRLTLPEGLSATEVAV